MTKLGIQLDLDVVHSHSFVFRNVCSPKL